MLRRVIPSFLLITSFHRDADHNRIGSSKLESNSTFTSVPSYLCFKQATATSVLVKEALEASEPPKLPPPQVRILSLDGGGVRGLFTAKVLHRLHQKLGNPLHEYFDIISGTSTGGILALGLTIPVSLAGAPNPRVHNTDELFRLYNEHAADIFPWSLEFFRLWSKYSPDGLKKLLKVHFSDNPLSGALAYVLIPAVSSDKSLVLQFFSHPSSEYSKALVTEVAQATSAAPSYFPPVVLHYGQKDVKCVDGGVSVNNPARLAFDQALLTFPNSSYYLVSIGTGESKFKYGEWGFWWARNVFDVVMQLQSSHVHTSLEHMTKTQSFPLKYERIQLALPREIPLDTTRRKDLDLLIKFANEFDDEQLDRIAAELKGKNLEQRVKQELEDFEKPRDKLDLESLVRKFVDLANLKQKYDNLISSDKAQPKRVYSDAIFDICGLQARILEILVQETLSKQGYLDEFARVLLNGAAHLRFRQAVVKPGATKPLEELAQFGVPAAKATLEYYRFYDKRTNRDKKQGEAEKNEAVKNYHDYYSLSKLKELDELAQIDPLAAIVYGFFEALDNRIPEAQQYFRLAGTFPAGKLFAAIYASDRFQQQHLLREASNDGSKFARCVKLQLESNSSCEIRENSPFRELLRQLKVFQNEPDKTWKWMRDHSFDILSKIVMDLRMENVDRVEILGKELSNGLLRNRTVERESSTKDFVSRLLAKVQKEMDERHP